MSVTKTRFKIMGIVFFILGLVPILIGGILYIGTNELLALIIPASMGGLFVILGIVFFIVGSNAVKMIRKIKTEGKRIEAEIYDVKINYAVKINRLTPNTYYLRYVDEITGQEHRFVSGYALKRLGVGDRITVFVDPSNYDFYFVDIA